MFLLSVDDNDGTIMYVGILSIRKNILHMYNNSTEWEISGWEKSKIFYDAV